MYLFLGGIVLYLRTEEALSASAWPMLASIYIYVRPCQRRMLLDAFTLYTIVMALILLCNQGILIGEIL